MRIAVANWNRRVVGGAETYLDAAIPALAEAGHEIGLFCEFDTPSDRDVVNVPKGSPIWCYAERGARELDELQAWKPDLIFAHGFNDPALGAALASGRKSVFYVHDYIGSCISGTKTHGFPSIQPCSKCFGVACLARFYPRRCGGLNPVLGWKLYVAQRQRLAMLRQYSVIATASEHMRRELINLGFLADCVRVVSSLVANSSDGTDLSEADIALLADRKCKRNRLSLLFAGRMVPVKGGSYLLDALPLVAGALRRPIDLILVGDGPERAEWTRRAEALQRSVGQIRVEFRGWISGKDLVPLADEAHLLVMPSLWPEPFGRSGLEFARWGVPSVAFAVGGIPEWLHDGVNGHLANGNPASPRGLAEAIVRALSAADHYAKLCVEAQRRVAMFNVADHIRRLTELFNEVVAA